IINNLGHRLLERDIEITGQTGIEGVLLQRSIMRISLERRTLDLLHLLHPDLEYKDIRSP
ncbi:hypothetical protein GW17_00027876, partial [Ensete ventricosum]